MDIAISHQRIREEAVNHFLATCILHPSHFHPVSRLKNPPQYVSQMIQYLASKVHICILFLYVENDHWTITYLLMESITSPLPCKTTRINQLTYNGAENDRKIISLLPEVTGINLQTLQKLALW